MTISIHHTTRMSCPGTGQRRPDQSGFSLIELMIVLVIIGVLVAVAVPAYTSYMQKSYRSDAKTALLDLASREEKYFSVNNQYTSSAASLYGGTTATFPMNVQSSSSSYYQLSAPTITAGSATAVASFSASAVPINSQSADACGTFTITSTGVTSVSGTLTNCW